MTDFVKYLVMAIVLRIDGCLCENLNACEVGSCLRKCCPQGEFLMNRLCKETEIEVDFSAIGVSPDARIHDGVVQCSESEERFLLEKSDNFYIKADNQLVFPQMNLTIPYTHYCVEMIENFTDPQALICYRAQEEEAMTHNSAGKHIPFVLFNVYLFVIRLYLEEKRARSWINIISSFARQLV